MAAHDGNLSQNQTEKLLQFQDLTGIDDITRCRDLLEVHNWVLESAVEDTLNIHDAPYDEPPRRQQQLPVVVSNSINQSEFRVSRPPPSGFMGWGYFVIMLPFRFVYSTLLGILGFAYRIVRPDPRRQLTDPLGDVMRFINSYDAKYGNMHPVFYQGTYSQALTDAKRELKFLLVYLHGDDHQDTREFCRLTLGNVDVIDFINTNMLFWGCSVNTSEGYRVSLALRENGYPFLAVIVLKDNRMTVVARFEGLVKPQELIDRLGIVIRTNEGAMLAAQADRNEMNLNQTLRKQQDEAYQESLKADQEKERQKREMEARKMEEEMDRRRALMREEERRNGIKQMKVELLGHIPDEPDLNNPDTIRIMIKLPQGLRLERRFLRNQSLKYLYYFVFCHPSSPDEFQIVTNFPRRVLPCKPDDNNPEPPTFADFQLGKAETLFVHDLEA